MRPRTPILSVLLYGIAALELVAGVMAALTAYTVAVGKDGATYAMTFALVVAAASAVVALVICGVAQAINYLGAAAFYAERTHDLVEREVERSRGAAAPKASTRYPH
jgi:hypothetical protein